MTLRHKVGCSVAGLLALLVGSEGFLVVASQRLHALNVELFDDAPSVDAAEGVEVGLQRIAVQDQAYDPADATIARRRRLAEAQSQLDEISFRARTGKERLEVASLRNDLVAIDPAAVDPKLIKSAMAKAADLSRLNRQEMTDAISSSEQLRKQAAAAAIILLVGGIVVGTIVARTLLRSITIPLARAFSVVRRIEAGDVSARMRLHGSDEFGRLGRAFDQMLDEAERREDDKAAFLAGVAHDLRTPLGTISFGLANLRRSLHDDETRTRADVIDRQVARLDRLLTELLDVSRLAAAPDLARRIDVPVHALVSEAYTLFKAGAPSHHFTLDVEPCWVSADADRLMRVLINLLSNAVKYSPAGGTIDLRVRALPGEAEISVRDRGNGIPETQREKIFERFTRLEVNAGADGNDGVSAVPGAGLGLYLSRRIAVEHGGQLDVEEAEGGGSRFFVRIPRVKPPQEPAPMTPERSGSLH
jgi:signal transduction histidine kinase